MASSSNEHERNHSWHQFFAHSLKLALTGVDITVYSDIDVMTNSPRADVLLLRNNHKTWTPRQRARLPDGIRDSRASHILIEFKYTESLTEKVFQKAMGYDIFYKESKELKNEQVQSYVVASKTPRPDTLEGAGYGPSTRKGVLVSKILGYRHIPIIVLNDLEDTPYNATFKLFASRLEQKRKAVTRIQKKSWNNLEYERFVFGLFRIWFKEEGMTMISEMSVEEVREMGKIFGDRYLELLPVEEKLKGVPVEEIHKIVTTESLLKGVPVEEKLKSVSVEELEAYLQKCRNGKP